MTRNHHEMITAEAAGALVLTFTVLLRPIGGRIIGALSAITKRKD